MDTNGTLQKAQAFVYSNGKDRPPTAINVDRALLRDLLFNQSPSKVGGLWSTMMLLSLTIVAVLNSQVVTPTALCL
jgi:hypothetical protein